MGLLLAFGAGGPASAGNLWDAVRGTIGQKVAQELDRAGNRVIAGGARLEATTRARQSPPDASSGFIAGDAALFRDDFSAAPIGSRPGRWKGNGSGRVVTVPGIDGKWLELQTAAIYKLAAPVELPARFTIEFDLIAATDRIDDLDPVTFGLARDNGVSGQDPRPLNEVSVYYHNSAGGYVGSDATDYHHIFDFDLAAYANRVMHVAMAVDGDNMAVYLDQAKVADTRLLDHPAAKYFYLVAPARADHGARLVFGNFRVGTFK